MSNKNIHHMDWNDIIYLTENLLYRKSDNKETAKYILNDNFLIIIWDNWGKEYFYLMSDLDYYQISSNNYFKLDNYISFVYLISNSVTNNFLLDNKTMKIYKKNNLDFLGYFEYNDNKLIITLNNEKNTYIYFNHKYYHEDYLNSLYDFINIYDVNYLLSKKDNVCYKNYNFFKKNTYIKYKNKIKIIDDNSSKIYINTYDNKANFIPYKELNEKNILINDENEKNIFINIYGTKNILDILPMLEFLINFNIKFVVFDDIKNLLLNDMYDDINFIYYDNLKDIISKYNIKKIYINADYNDNYKFDNINLIFYNNIYEDIIKNNSIDIKERWYNLNNDKLDNYKYLLKDESKSIPKIMHFIWIGNNKIPDIYLEYIESWLKNHNDWIFCFWNDQNIPKLINQKYYDDTDIFAMKADILRYELLYIFGGVYIDCDFLCLKNIDEIISNYIGFSGYESTEYIAIGIMGFIKYDNILSNIIKNISYNIITNTITNTKKSIPELTGPIFFTDMWNKYNTNKHYAFPINYFYSYTFQDKNENKKYNIKDDNYAIHMWGYSWNKDIVIKKNNDDINYILKLYLSNIIILLDQFNPNIKYSELSNYLKNIICFKPNNNHKKAVVHIMGVFFTGGIERYIHYIDKYGNHDKYCYYLLYIDSGSLNNYVYNLKNIKMYSFGWNHDYLNNLLQIINPRVIIDHYSLYINDNSDIYKNINRDNILYFVHSAICYDNNISKLCINKCINLYDEINKHESWKNIENNYYVTLGTELNLNGISKRSTENIHISIIGRIAEEKIPILFLNKLCDLSNKLDNIIINIYGEKDNIFNKNYIIKFEEIIINSKIIIHDFVNPLKINEIYENTDILLIPSKYETGSFTCIEAYSYGIPVIARNVYGLKYLIKNNITGYLCDDDEHILDIIKNINLDPILNNREIIYKNSYYYNIINKIKDLENIISQNLIEKNIVIITSVLNCIDKPLSYYHTRNVFTIEERYKQTLMSIDTVKKYIPNVEILYCECSNLSKNIDIEDEIKKKVNYYYNFFENDNIRTNVESSLKGMGEASILLEAFKKLHNIKVSYKNIFKLSGRYYINDNFNYNLFDNDKNIFTNWDNSNSSYATLFYKINMSDIHILEDALLNSINDLKDEKSIEYCMFNYFNKNIKIVDKMNVSGHISTEGYFFTI